MIDAGSSYHVQLPTFEGPLDLLLNLVQRRELDITAISLASVADQYLEHINSLEQTDPDALVGFLVIAAKLLVIKSWALFPSSTPSAEEEEEAQDLATALIEYQLFKTAAEELRLRQEADNRSYPRIARVAAFSQPTLEKLPVEQLAAAFLRYTRQKAEEHIAGQIAVELPTRVHTVAEKIDTIRSRIASEARVGFKSLLLEAASSLEIIVTFIAVLEMLKWGQVDVEQEGLFAEIYLVSMS